MKQTITITKEEDEFTRKILALEDFAEGYDCDGVIMTKTADFGDGIQADIKLCNGDGPYVDPVLFENGHEVLTLEVRDTFAGVYRFSYGGEEYLVEVEVEEGNGLLVRCIVAGINSNGEPDLFFVKVSCSQEEYDNGAHYDAAKDAAEAAGGDPAIAFDENDAAGAAMLPLFNWDTASTVEVQS